MAGHADDTLGRQHHGGCPNSVAAEMTASAGSIIQRSGNVMDFTNDTRLRIPFPQDLSGSGFFQRHDSLEVTCSTGYPQVHFVGHFGIVRQMTPLAVPHDLLLMAKFSRLGMAYRAGDIRMGGGAVGGHINQRMPRSFSAGMTFAGGAMTVKTENGYLLDRLRVFRG